MRFRDQDDDDITVDLSPLIDCVFLLLIFFLVTTMMKKMEKQIPVTLPEMNASVSQQPLPTEVLVGVDEAGNYYQETGRDQVGAPIYKPVPDLLPFLHEIAAKHSTDQALRIDANPDTEFQIVIDTLDICQLQGFQNTGVRIRKPGQGSVAAPTAP